MKRVYFWFSLLLLAVALVDAGVRIAEYWPAFLQTLTARIVLSVGLTTVFATICYLVACRRRKT